MGKALLLDDLYVVSQYLRETSKFDNRYKNIGITSRMVYKVGVKYYYLDNDIEAKLYNIGQYYEDEHGEKVALTPLANKETDTYNYMLPFVFNEKIDMNIKVIGGKRYVKREEVYRFSQDYNLKLHKAYDEDIKYLKGLIKNRK